MRAVVFHLGVLQYLAEQNMLDDIAHISTVSGASICIGLLYTHNQNQWPNQAQFFEKVFSKLRKSK